MRIWAFCTRKRTSGDLSESSTDQEASLLNSQTLKNHEGRRSILLQVKRKGKTIFRKEWEKKYPRSLLRILVMECFVLYSGSGKAHGRIKRSHFQRCGRLECSYLNSWNNSRFPLAQRFGSCCCNGTTIRRWKLSSSTPVFCCCMGAGCNKTVPGIRSSAILAFLPSLMANWHSEWAIGVSFAACSRMQLSQKGEHYHTSADNQKCELLFPAHVYKNKFFIKFLTLHSRLRVIYTKMRCLSLNKRLPPGTLWFCTLHWQCRLVPW